MESNETTYGLYFVESKIGTGKVSPVQEFPNDLVATIGFKRFISSEKLGDLPKKFQLVRICKMSQITDRPIFDTFQIVCNDANYEEFISNEMLKYEE